MGRLYMGVRHSNMVLDVALRDCIWGVSVCRDEVFCIVRSLAIILPLHMYRHFAKEHASMCALRTSV